MVHVPFERNEKDARDHVPRDTQCRTSGEAQDLAANPCYTFRSIYHGPSSTQPETGSEKCATSILWAVLWV